MTTITEAPSRGFTTDEYVRRASAVQQAMQTDGIDLLWLTTEADVRYLSGFLTQFWQSPTRPWHLLLPATGKPVAVIPSIGEACMQRTWLDDIRTWSSPDPEDDGLSLLASTMNDLAGASMRVGTPMGAETTMRYPLNEYQRLKEALPNAQWCDATDTLRRVRQIKSPAEIEKLRHICQITSHAFADIPTHISKGMSEIEVFRRFKERCLYHGADDTAFVVGTASQGGYNDIISPPTDDPLCDGDVLIIDTGCTYDGYFSDFDRNFSVGVLDDVVCDAQHRLWDATEKGLETLRPGVSCQGIFQAMNSILQETSGNVGRFGHGLGIQLTETPSITPFDTTVVQTGMVLTLEPGYTFAPGKMLVHEENVVVTENGYELLSTRAPRDMMMIS